VIVKETKLIIHELDAVTWYYDNEPFTDKKILFKNSDTILSKIFLYDGYANPDYYCYIDYSESWFELISLKCI
jgi:hypothetical protein